MLCRAPRDFFPIPCCGLDDVAASASERMADHSLALVATIIGGGILTVRERLYCGAMRPGRAGLLTPETVLRKIFRILFPGYSLHFDGLSWRDQDTAADLGKLMGQALWVRPGQNGV